MSETETEFDICELDGLKAICDDMSDELFEAREMICWPWKYKKKAPEAEPLSATSGA